MLALFDLDNTLVDRLDAFRRWAAEFAAERKLGPRAVPWLEAADADGSVPMDAFFARVRDRFGLPEPAGELWRAYRARLPHLIRCRPEVLDGLERLRAAGWTVGIATNGMTDNQTGKIRHSGLATRVHGWAVSEAEGVRKPDARLFAIAAARCGTSLEGGGWMVGDDAVNDIEGGRSAGLRTIWIDRGRTPQAPASDHVVGDVVAAIGLLAGMRLPGADR
ncbi:putative hydrolase of the HAD superfamily [Nonomuraea thailandensis]|uniref:Hydrolase of the HAD superfamily n=1 Tax=Nonomuraea thailandensis TaxID=1188745 RepID=A0A9X2GAV1_9ACTN|nr:HAD family hydrolase [Nonomuraea thailandensis]MCP2353974.1 putative hydrolase of the HAD superfamily [Nonomuraea thailandensis]